MSHDTTARRVFGVTHRTIVRRILATFDRATASDVESGARWYDAASELASTLSDPTLSLRVEHVAAILSHLSPRTSWTRNVAGAVALIGAAHDDETGDAARSAARAVGCMGDNVDRAMVALYSPTPLDTFGPTAPKTRSFAANIAGDREAVTVDVWAMRVVGLDETLLKRAGAYDAVAHAYRLAARARGVDPATMQATTWIVARNGRAA